MANQPWLDEVQRQLAENGLPPSYIRRFMDELADHLEDLKEETMSKETNHFGSALPHQRANTSPAEYGGRNETSHLSQLGEPSEIANAATIAYRQRTFFGRHPIAKFLVFGVSPVFAMILGFILVTTSFGIFELICQKCGIHLTHQDYLGGLDPSALNWGMSILSTILPAGILTLLYCKWAKRSNLSKRWMLASCCLLAVVAMSLFQRVTCSDTPGKSQYAIGMMLSSKPTLLQWVQLLTPLAAGLWFMRRTREKQTDTDDQETLQAAA